MCLVSHSGHCQGHRSRGRGGKASQGRQPHPWGSSCACLALLVPSLILHVPRCLGCRVIGLLVAPKPSGCAPVAQATPGSCAGGPGPLEHLLGHRGAHFKWALTGPPPAGCPKGFYGKHCRKKCHCANRGRCHRLYGACLCDPGLYGRFCHLGESPCPQSPCPRGQCHCALPPTIGPGFDFTVCRL